MNSLFGFYQKNIFGYVLKITSNYTRCLHVVGKRYPASGNKMQKNISSYTTSLQQLPQIGDKR